MPMANVTVLKASCWFGLLHSKLSPIRTSPVVKNFKSSLVLDQINFELEAYARAPFMVRQACPECSRRAHHERLSLNTARPELSRRAYFIKIPVEYPVVLLRGGKQVR